MTNINICNFGTTINQAWYTYWPQGGTITFKLTWIVILIMRRSSLVNQALIIEMYRYGPLTHTPKSLSFE